jgi:N-methylhydantoinase A
MPIKTPTIDLAEVGAGGGSVAWLDPEGVLRVGPRSSGAMPGPACYALGGTEPTVTDANLVLGYLSAKGFASGSLNLDVAAAHHAIEARIASPLGTSVERAAWAIHESVNASMASAIHVVTVQRGLDPRNHTLIAFGGAGPMHAVGVATEFGIDHVIAPPEAGVASAIGMQSTDLTAEQGRTFLVAADELSPKVAKRLFDEIETAARAKMGVASSESGLEIERFLDTRFVGQAHEVSIPVSAALDEAALAEVPSQFRARYAELYGIAPQGRVEIAAFRVRLRLPVARPPIADAASPAAREMPEENRRAWFLGVDGPEALVTAVVDREDLHASSEIAGPLIIHGAVDTTVVPPGWGVRVDDVGSLHLTRERGSV